MHFKDTYSCNSTSLDKGLSTIKPVEWQSLTSPVEVLIGIICLQVNFILQLSNHRYITLKGPLYEILQ